MRRIALSAAALLAAAAPGCQTVAPSALPGFSQRSSVVAGSEFSYAGGRAVQTFAQPPTTVQPAVITALGDLRIEELRQTTEAGSVVFEGTTADNRKATVTLRPHPAGSRLSVRVGLFGDQPLSRAIMDRVGVRLGALPPSAVPADAPSAPDANPYFSRAAVPDSEMLKGVAEAPYRGTVVP